MPFDLKNKVIIITGASQGIGADTARLFATEEAKVVLAARSLDLLGKLAAEIREKGGEALPVETDLTSAEEIKALARAALDEWGRIDVWVNNAGLGADYCALFSREEWVKQLFDVNLMAVYNGMRAAAHAMMQNDGNSPRGIIVNVSTIMGLMPVFPEYTIYQATKKAVDAMSEGFSLELVPNDIRVINVIPGLTKSNFSPNMLRVSGEKGVPRGVHPKIVAETIVRSVKKGKSRLKVYCTVRDRFLVFLSRILKWPARLMYARKFARRDPYEVVDD